MASKPSNGSPEYEWMQVTEKAAFAPRDGAGALVFGGRMWLLGGWNRVDKTEFPARLQQRGVEFRKTAPTGRLRSQARSGMRLSILPLIGKAGIAQDMLFSRTGCGSWEATRIRATITTMSGTPSMGRPGTM